MNKVTLTLNEIIRFVFTGYVFYGIVQFVGIHPIKRMYCLSDDLLGGFGRHIVIFATGVFIYFIYRTVMYPGLSWVGDYFNENENVRSYISNKERRISRWLEANDLAILSMEPEWNIDPAKIWSASVHMLHMTGLLCVLGGVVASIPCSNTEGWLGWLAGVGLVLILFGMYSDIQFEKRKFRNMAIVNQIAFNRAISKYTSRRPDDRTTGTGREGKADRALRNTVALSVGLLGLLSAVGLLMSYLVHTDIRLDMKPDIGMEWHIVWVGSWVFALCISLSAISLRRALCLARIDVIDDTQES